jgi:hypothetical protein
MTVVTPGPDAAGAALVAETASAATVPDGDTSDEQQQQHERPSFEDFWRRSKTAHRAGNVTFLPSVGVVGMCAYRLSHSSSSSCSPFMSFRFSLLFSPIPVCPLITTRIVLSHPPLTGPLYNRPSAHPSTRVKDMSNPFPSCKTAPSHLTSVLSIATLSRLDSPQYGPP